MSYAKIAHAIGDITAQNDGFDRLIFTELTGIPISSFGNGHYGGNVYIPQYTGSLEAAAKLLPDGYTYILQADGQFNTSVQVWDKKSKGFGVRFGATPALALARAALFVRAELFGEDLSVCEENKPTPRPEGSRPERF